MAYTVVMTKESVNKLSNVLYSISIKTTINDGSAVVFEKTFTVQYNTNSSDMDIVIAEYLAKVKNAWDRFVEERNVYLSSAFNTAIADMQTQAQAYIDS